MNDRIAAERGQEPYRQFQDQGSQTAAGPSILLVENKEVFLTLAQSAIELLPCSYRIITASCGEAALEILRTNDIDLIVAANHLPDMDGFRLVKLVKTISSTPVIIWTSESDPKATAMLKELGCPRVHCQKPHDLYELEDSITTLLPSYVKPRHNASSPRLEGDSQTLFEQGAALARAHHFREAKKALTDSIKTAPENPEAWLWLSRCLNKVSDIEEYLQAAKDALPNDPQIDAELKTISDFKAATGADQVRRCPFCWSPINPKKAQCSRCQAYMIFHKKIDPHSSNVDLDLLNIAIANLQQVGDLARNPNVLYYLGLGYFNAGRHADAEEQLRKAITVAANKKFFEDQLAALQQIPANQSGIAAEGGTGNEKTIFVVEDSPTTRKVIVKTLHEAGYKTMEAKDGLEALSMLNTFTPDLILLDIILPKMDGYKVLSVIKNTGTDLANTPVIMLTSKNGMLDKLKGKLAGTNAYLTKPFRSNELTSTIEKQLARSDSPSEATYQN